MIQERSQPSHVVDAVGGTFSKFSQDSCNHVPHAKAPDPLTRDMQSILVPQSTKAIDFSNAHQVANVSDPKSEVLHHGANVRPAISEHAQQSTKILKKLWGNCNTSFN